ncbi:MAG: protein-glutamate O-methyltransferase CheR [Coxiellaceae bacterium]|nr:protein-glutamate O-methyltransferase CheR [Coxiellaceae bacterium]
MKKVEIESLEVNLLLEAIQLRYGYDFTQYAKASLKRRLHHMLASVELNNISELIPKVLYDDEFFSKFVINMSVTVTEMFRDPKFYCAFKESVIPILNTYPFIKIWHAGCATGEEVYSMAILLHEAGLLERTQLYGTDFNPLSLQIAADGIYPSERIKEYTENYNKVSNEASFSDYYHSKYGSVKMSDQLRKRIIFTNHNLVTDHHFGEMNVVVCRNVLIYFDLELQNRVLSLFKDSLVHRGVLCLGTKESLINTDAGDAFESISREQRIYRLKRLQNHGA